MATITVKACDRCGSEARSDGDAAAFGGFIAVQFGFGEDKPTSRDMCLACALRLRSEYDKQPKDMPVLRASR